MSSSTLSPGAQLYVDPDFRFEHDPEGASPGAGGCGGLMWGPPAGVLDTGAPDLVEAVLIGLGGVG